MTTNKKASSFGCKFKKYLKFSAVAALAITGVMGVAYAADGGTASTSLTGIANNVATVTNAMISIISSVSIIASIGFVVAFFLKLRQHSQNPQQVPLSQAIIPLIVGIFLGVLPTVITLSQKSFTGKGSGSSIGGSATATLFGGKGTSSTGAAS